MLLAITATGFSQGCLPEGITFTTQQQIDDFQTDYPGCTEIEGDVYINSNDITNLAGLNILVEIGGELIIGESNNTNPNLLNLEGLDNITSIGGNLDISFNTGLVNLVGLQGLTSIGGELMVHGNTSINSLDGMDNVVSMDGLSIYNNAVLSDLSALGNLTSIPGNLSIGQSLSLVNLSGLENLTSIGGYLTISGNNGLSDLSGLDGLTSIGGNLNLVGNQFLSNLQGFENLISIGGRLSIGNNINLTDISMLNNLTTILGSLSISANTVLVNLIGLENIAGVGEDLEISSNLALVSLSGIGNISTIGGELLIDNNDNLPSLSGLDSIQPNTITDLTITNNSSLSTCHVQSICDYLASPNGTINIYGNAPGCNSQTEVEDACWVKVYETAAIENSISIFPNPAKNTITILNSSKAKINEVFIYSPSGQIILQKKSPINTIDISKLKAGLYFVEVKTEIGDVRRKLIVE